jgi:hypothetical protein
VYQGLLNSIIYFYFPILKELMIYVSYFYWCIPLHECSRVYKLNRHFLVITCLCVRACNAPTHAGTHTNLYSIILTPHSTVLLEKLTGFQLLNKFPAFYGTRRFITEFTKAHHLTLSWARWIKSMPIHPKNYTVSALGSFPVYKVLFYIGNNSVPKFIFSLSRFSGI